MSIQASNWVTHFNSLGGKCFGYEKARVTPYMHSMVYHIPRFMKNHGSMKTFTGQGNTRISRQNLLTSLSQTQAKLLV